MLAAAAWLAAGHQAVDAGHTWDNKHCQSSGAITCRYVYSEAGKDLIATQSRFALWSWRTATRWDVDDDEPFLDLAEAEWAKADGPQVPVEPFPSGPDFPFTNNFMKTCVTDGDPLNFCFVGSGILAYVCNFSPSGQGLCQDPPDSPAFHNIDYSDIYLNSIWYDETDIFRRAGTMAHEIGHTLGLAHHLSNPACLMYTPASTRTVNTPQSCDIGSAYPGDPVIPQVAPCDGSSEDYGIRCIYEWWREHDPPLVNCPDINRDGLIDLPNDILGVILAFDPLGLLAGEEKFNPDADMNHDGVVDLPNDVLGTVLKFQQPCSSFSYPHS